MQVFASCLAWGPLAIYLLVLGAINLRSRPLVVGGGRETAALALALAGCVLTGPAQLLVPARALERFGGNIWPLAGLFYCLVVALMLLTARPRLVVFNARAEDVRAALNRLAAELGGDSRWAGNTLVLDRLGVELRLEEFAWMNNVSLIANSSQQSLAGWRHVDRHLRAALAEVRTCRSRRGALLVAVGALLLVALVCRVVGGPATAVQGMQDFLAP
jgi:hypothetical protein